MKIDTLKFITSSGYERSGQLETPEITPIGWALYAHNSTSSSDMKVAAKISRSLVTRGIGVLRLDFAGSAYRGGAFGMDGLDDDVTDLLDATNAMNGTGRGVSILLGQRFESAAVLVAAPYIPALRAVVTIGFIETRRHADL